MANELSSERLVIGGRVFGSLYNAPQRISIPVTIGSKFDLILTLTGSNWSLGTTDKRYLRCLVSRRYNGSISISELEGNGNRFTGTFQSQGVGVISETSNNNTCILQLHNPYSNGASSGFTAEYEIVSGGASFTPTMLQSYTGSSYTSNNIF